MMKKIGLFIVMASMFALAACSATPSAQAAEGNTATGSQTAEGTPQPRGQTDTESKLLIGTFKLEGTDQAVTAEQASELLPLWKGLKALGSSETTSAEEISALYSQIEEAMTAEQMKAIDAMDISFQSTSEIMTQLGITPQAGGFGGFSGTPSAEQEATRQALAQAGRSGGGGGFSGGGGGGGAPGGGGGGGGGGGFPAGGGGGNFPEGGGNFGGGEFPGENGQSGTAVAGRGGASLRIDSALLDALIKLLEERAG